MLRDVLIIGAIAAVVIILLRLILGSPIIQRIRETFVSGSHITNKYTECPPSSKLYMFQGKAFCCSGNIDPLADSPAGSCKTSLTGSMPAANNVFCTLGPTTSDGVVNCIETKAGLIQADEDTYCTPAMPTFVPGYPPKGACCASANSDGTGCTTSTICVVGGNPDLFNNPLWSCELFKAQGEDGACPSGYNPNQVTAPNPSSTVTNLYNCTSSTAVCYQKATIDRLREAKYDVSNLTQCSVLG